MYSGFLQMKNLNISAWHLFCKTYLNKRLSYRCIKMHSCINSISTRFNGKNKGNIGSLQLV